MEEDDAQVECSLKHYSLENFVQLLNCSGDDDEVVILASRHMYALPLPPGWSEEVDRESESIFFYYEISDLSAWTHPQEQLFAELLDEVRSWGPEESTETIMTKVETHMHQAHSAAVRTISDWTSVPCDQQIHGQSEYYVKRTTGESKWVDPRESLEFDLGQRQSVLIACLQAHDERHERVQSKVLTPEPGACLQAPDRDETHEELSSKVCAPKLESQLHSVPTAGRKRQRRPLRPPHDDKGPGCLMGAESSRSLPARISDIRLMPLQLPSPPTSHRSHPPERTLPGHTLRDEDFSSPSTPASSTAEASEKPQPATAGKQIKVPTIMLNGDEVDQVPPPVPSVLLRPPTTPCRWLAHARFVNSQVRSENDELQLLIAQLRKNVARLKQLGSDSEEIDAALAEQKALLAETAALKSRSRYYLSRSTGVLSHPKSGKIASPKPPSTPRPEKFLTPR
eukprot:TRINITY_DN6981_c0_g1_i1.p1 TRINITY_DN6981_c0_g1~~TRINITY_DN6981_c0_g1_i1.p1  ORF type:complete len:466 (+),score=70.45 TRINITY_DN6981_c0_g1_i1:38-1399(+)